MAHHLKAAQPTRDLVLHALQVLIVELDDEAALLADHVIVVLGVAGHLVAGLAVAELAGRGQTAGGQELERTIDGCVAHARMPAAHARQQLLDRNVALAAQEDVDDGLALVRGLETLAPQELAPLRLERLGIRVADRRHRRHDRSHNIDQSSWNG